MKLHLPKQLFTALLAVITLAAPAAVTFGSAAWGAVDTGVTGTNKLGVSTMDNFYAGNYAITFNVIAGEVGKEDSSDVLALYGGDWSGANDRFNGYSISYVNGNIELKVGEGKASSAGLATAPAISEDTTFMPTNADIRSEAFGYKLTEGKTYTLQNIGGDKNQTVLLYEGDILVDAVQYNGNMAGGDANKTMTSAGNESYGVASTTRQTYTTWDGTAAFTEPSDGSSYGNLVFMADKGSNTTVNARSLDMSGTISAQSITILGAYTFNLIGDTSLSTTNGIAVGTGKTLIFAGNKTLTLAGSVTNNGTLKFNNAILTGTITNNGELILSGSNSSGIIKADAAVTKNADNTVTHTGATINNAGHIDMSGLYISGSTKGDVENQGERKSQYTSLINSIVGGTVLLNSGDFALQLGGMGDLTPAAVDFRSVYTVGASGDTADDGSFTLANYSGSTLWRVSEGGGLNVNKTLRIANKQDLYIAGGSVIAGDIKLAHDSNEHPGATLTISSGSLKTSSIRVEQHKTADKQTEITMTGGSLEFTTSGSAITVEDNTTAPVVSITGGTLISKVSGGWTLDATGWNKTPYISNVTIDGDNTGSITLKGVALEGLITNNASLTTNEEGLIISGSNIIAMSTTFGGSGITKVSGTLTGDGSLIKTGTGTLTLSGANTYTGGTTITGGTLKLGHNSALGSSNVIVGTGAELDVNGNQFTVAGKTITLDKGATLANNSSTNIYANVNQFSSLTLLGDANVVAHGRLGLVNTTTTKTQLNLGTYTLNKTGSENFVLLGTTITGTGTIKLTEGGMLIGHINGSTTVSGTGATLDLGSRTDSGATVLNVEHAESILKVAGIKNGSGGTVANKGVIEFHGSGEYSTAAIFTEKGTLKLLGTGDYSYTGSSNDNNIEINNTDGTFILNSDSEQSLTGTFSGTGGTLVKKGAGNATLAGIINFSNGSLDIQAGTLNITQLDARYTLTVNVEDGAILNLGSVDVQTVGHGLTPEGDVTNTYTGSGIAGNTSNGYLQTVGKYHLFDGYAWVGGSVAGFEVVADTENNLTYLTQNGEKGTLFYVNEETENYNTQDSSLQISSDYTTGIVLNGGNLNMQSALNQNASGGISVQKEALITIGSGVSLNCNQVSFANDATATLAGSGTLNLGEIATVNVAASSDLKFSLGSEWMGTVKFGPNTLFNNTGLDLDNFANVNAEKGIYSTVELDGVSGYFGNSMEMSAILKLTGAGLVLDNTYSGTEYKFHNTILGNGQLKITKDLNSTFTFNGDTSGWTGNLIQTTGNYTYHFKGSTIIANNFESSSAGENFKVNVSNAQDVSLTGTLKANDGTSIKVERMDSNGNLSVKSVELVGTGSVKVQGLQLSATDTTTASEQAPAFMKVTERANGALTYLAQEASFSITDMTLSGVKISADADTEVVLSNVSAQEVELTSGQFTMANKATVDTGGNTDLLSGITLKNTGASAASLTVDLGNLYSLGVQGKDGKFSLTITLDGFTMESMEYVEGKGLIFAEDSWLERLLADQGASEYVSGSIDSPEVAALANNNTVKVEFASAGTGENGANVGTVIRITGLSVIPEPATTTLGLVALAALVTRRRRK